MEETVALTLNKNLTMRSMVALAPIITAHKAAPSLSLLAVLKSVSDIFGNMNTPVVTTTIVISEMIVFRLSTTACIDLTSKE